MSEKQAELRKVTNSELRIVLLGQDATERGTLRSKRVYHILRETVNGRKIGGCDLMKKALHEGDGYYTVPFLPFIVDAIEKDICFFCHLETDVDGRLRP